MFNNFFAFPMMAMTRDCNDKNGTHRNLFTISNFLGTCKFIHNWHIDVNEYEFLGIFG